MNRTIVAPAAGTCALCFHAIEPGDHLRNYRLGFAHDVCPKSAHGVTRPDPGDLESWNARLAADNLKVGRGAVPKKRQAKGLDAKKANGSMPDGGPQRFASRTGGTKKARVAARRAAWAGQDRSEEEAENRRRLEAMAEGREGTPRQQAKARTTLRHLAETTKADD